MATTKRQRKKENQAARRAALEAARKRQQRKRQIISFGAMGVGVLLLALILVFVAGRGGDDKGAAPTKTTATTAPGKIPRAEPVPAGRAIKGDTPCPKADGSEERASSFEKPPPTSPMCIDPKKQYTAVFDTTEGMVKVKLDPATTPITTNNFVVLARYHYYDGSAIFRTDTSIEILQGGGPTSQSPSDPGPGYTIKDEGAFSIDPATKQSKGPYTYQEGDLIMARKAEPDSTGAQYFFAAGPKVSSLDASGTYLKLGKVVEGLDVVKKVLSLHVADPENQLGSGPSRVVIVKKITIEET